MSFQVTSNPLGLRTGTLILAMTIAMISPAQAIRPDLVEPTTRPNDLLRQAVANELPHPADEFYTWMQRQQKPRGSVTKLMVNTPEGILARTVALNDRALTAEERRQDDQRINRLLDPDKMRDKAKKQQDDQQHIERLLRALPDAFQCEYAAVHDDRNLRLDCSPNPNFSAPNYESQVLRGMKTVILIDRDDRRITRIEGTLSRDVNFGWGILGRLNRGGHIEIAQSKVTGKHWDITRMQLTFEGRVIVVKPLNIQQTDTSWNYRSVPKMTVAQALEFLRSSPVKPSP
jgi:hypothetical protein